MKYEMVELEEKAVAGIRIRTSNRDPEMFRAIGNAWQRFFQEGVYEAIPGKKNAKSIGLYTHYEPLNKDAYDMLACCEIAVGHGLPEGIAEEVIAAGKYAKFVIHGQVQHAVAEFWRNLPALGLKRKYSCDFEEYQADEAGYNPEKAEIHIYISLEAAEIGC